MSLGKRNAAYELRLKPSGAAQGSIGTQFTGLAATPRGAANTAVMNWLGAAVTRRAASDTPPASAAAATPINHTPDANAGSLFNFVVRGVWRVEMALVIPASSVVNFGFNLATPTTEVAADFVVATAPVVGDGSRNRAFRRTTLPAATEITVVTSTEVHVQQGNVDGATNEFRLRGIISNGAGAVVDPADVTVALAYIDFTWLRDVA